MKLFKATIGGDEYYVCAKNYAEAEEILKDVLTKKYEGWQPDITSLELISMEIYVREQEIR